MYGYYGHDYDYGTTPDPSVRAADTDREATADRLRQHHAEGRIDVTEFQDRIDHTYQAKTVGELHQLVSDLPRDPQPGPRGRGPRLRRLWMVPWIPLLFLIIAISALTGRHHAGLWVLIPIFFLARIRFWGRRPWHTRYQSPHA
jgi:Flp pilus assembly protein TadB